MDDWDAVSEDEENFEEERRTRELNALQRRFETLGFEAGLNSEQDMEPVMQKSFDAAFADAMTKGFTVGKSIGFLSCIKFYQQQDENKKNERAIKSSKNDDFDPVHTMEVLKQCIKADPSVKNLIESSKPICESIDAHFSKLFPATD